MNLVNFEDHLRAQDLDEEETPSERLLSSLRMHDQMLSCLTFVAEQATKLYPANADLEPVYGSIELIGEKRAEVAKELSRIGTGR